MAERDADRSVSQTVRAQLSLRDLIFGRLAPGRAHLRTAGGRDHRRVAHAGADGAGAAGGRGPAGGDPVRRLHGEGVFRARHPRFHRAARHARRTGRAFCGRARRLRARPRAAEGMPCRDRWPGPADADLGRGVLVLCRAECALPCALDRIVAQPAVDPADRSRLRAAVRIAKRICDGAVGAAGSAADPADRAGPAPHRGRRHREPGRRRAPKRSCANMRGLPRAICGWRCATGPISICCRRWR